MKKVAALAFSIVIVTPAFAHEHWISQGGYRDPVSGESCCGEEDCHVLLENEFQAVEGGWVIISTGERIEHARELVSQDGQYWRCQWGNHPKTRCFFIPFQGS